MREILFRGKRKDSCGWIKGYYIFRKIWESDVHIIRIVDNGFDSYIEFEVIPETVGQYTGLTDKNGKEIFEGDILRRAYHPEDDVAVLWHDGRFCFKKVKKINKDYPFESECCIQNAVKWLKVIGNVHDNPELLKEAEQK